jgi:hypothetical protein
MQPKDTFASNCVLYIYKLSKSKKEPFLWILSLRSRSYLTFFCNSASQNSYLRILLRHHDDVLALREGLYKAVR